MGGVCVARQPIFGTAGDVAGYELLFGRPSSNEGAGGVDRGAMSPDVMVRAVIDIGLDQLTSGRSAFMKFTREMLLARTYTLVAPQSVVIELLETVEPDDDVEAACEELVDAGYSLALDNFVWDPGYRRLLELATIVKVDVLGQPAARLDEIAQRLAVYDVRLLAGRVETADVRAMCAGLGYELFQGSYYAHLGMVTTDGLRSDEITIARAINLLRDTHTTDADVEAAFSADVSLSCKLLRMVNSPACGGRGIESVTDAVQLSGRTELSKWLALLLVSSIAARGAANRELLHLAVQRARMCELLAASTSPDRETSAPFLVGLFSLLDPTSRVPMIDLLESITLASPLCGEALVGRAGPYAGLLTLVEAYEQGAWSRVKQHATSSGIDVTHVRALYLQSLAWTRDRLLSLA